MLGMVLAAGLGTRLRPLTNALPKPAVPVANRPLATFAVDHLLRAGAREVRINAHHLADRLVDALTGDLGDTAPLRFFVEPTLLGTGGGLRAALADSTDDLVVVMNGDILFAPDLAAAVETHRRSGALATLVVRRHPDPFRLGAVEVDARGRIHRIAGAPEGESPVLEPFVFTGVHVLSRAVLAALPTEGCVVRRAYQPLLARGALLAAHVDDSPWLDLGTPASYFDANLRLANGTLRFAGVEPNAAGLIAASAQIEGHVVGSVVGANVRVGPGVTVENAVVWPNTRVDRSVSRAILTPDALVDVP